jgi:hypothetical protein
VAGSPYFLPPTLHEDEAEACEVIAEDYRRRGVKGVASAGKGGQVFVPISVGVWSRLDELGAEQLAAMRKREKLAENGEEQASGTGDNEEEEEEDEDRAQMIGKLLTDAIERTLARLLYSTPSIVVVQLLLLLLLLLA